MTAASPVPWDTYNPMDWIEALPEPAMVIDAGKDLILVANHLLAQILNCDHASLPGSAWHPPISG